MICRIGPVVIKSAWIPASYAAFEPDDCPNPHVPALLRPVLFGGTVALKKVSAFLLQAMQTDISREDLLERMLNQYEVDRKTAERDLEEILATFRKLGLIED